MIVVIVVVVVCIIMQIMQSLMSRVFIHLIICQFHMNKYLMLFVNMYGFIRFMCNGFASQAF